MSNYYINWNRDMSTTYLYGSKIEIKAEGIYFENPLMPPGAVINTWKSHTDYQADRMAPDLPLLKKNITYVMEWEITSKPVNTLTIRLKFFNQANVVILENTLRESGEEFTIPKYTYKYTLELLNSGVNAFTFYSIRIKEQNE